MGDLGDSLRGWAVGPGGPVLCGRGSAPPACSTDCALGRHADCREGLGPGFPGPRIKVPGWVRPPSFPRFAIRGLKRALRGTRRRWDSICPRLRRSHRALRLAHKARTAPRWLFPGGSEEAPRGKQRKWLPFSSLCACALCLVAAFGAVLCPVFFSPREGVREFPVVAARSAPLQLSCPSRWRASCSRIFSM